MVLNSCTSNSHNHTSLSHIKIHEENIFMVFVFFLKKEKWRLSGHQSNVSLLLICEQQGICINSSFFCFRFYAKNHPVGIFHACSKIRERLSLFYVKTYSLATPAQHSCILETTVDLFTYNKVWMVISILIDNGHFSCPLYQPKYGQPTVYLHLRESCVYIKHSTFTCGIIYFHTNDGRGESSSSK